MKRWQAVLLAAHNAICQPRHHRPLVLTAASWCRPSPTRCVWASPAGASLMANRLEPLNLRDFTGGLNLRANQFQLAPNESPEMENIAIDPLGGIYTRKGWRRWNDDDIVDPDTAPGIRAAPSLVQLSDGTDLIYVAANNTICTPSDVDGTFTDLGVVADADPHMADFAVFGDDIYIACGREQPDGPPHRHRRRRRCSPPPGPPTGTTTTSPRSTVSPPQAELVEAHSGYLFAANIEEDGVDHPNRIRWSHPTSPDDWAQADFIDIDIGGNHITALHVLRRPPADLQTGLDLGVVRLRRRLLAARPEVVDDRHAVPADRDPQRNRRLLLLGSDRGGIYAYGGERAHRDRRTSCAAPSKRSLAPD